MDKKLTLNDRTEVLEDGTTATTRYEAGLEDAIVYEFYVPNTMLGKSETGQFLRGVIDLPGGGTVFPDVLGVWQSQVEKVTIYRIMVRARQFGPEGADRWIADEIARLMHELKSTSAAQHEILFTKSRCEAYSVKAT